MELNHKYHIKLESIFYSGNFISKTAINVVSFLEKFAHSGSILQ